MDKVLIYSGLLSILYIENGTRIENKEYKALEPFFDNVIVSDTIEEYITHHRVLGVYPDIIMIDAQKSWKSAVEIIEEICQLNYKQMIVIVNSQYTKEQLATLMKFKICYSLDKPLGFDDLYRVAFDASKEIYDARLLEANTKMLHQRVTELDNSIQNIQYARETKDQFFANISHEIRTPINAVIGLSHILLDSNLGIKHSDYISKIKTSGDLILSIVNDILDFSKIEAGKLSVEEIEFNINTVLESASTMISFKAYEKNLELIFDIDDSVPALIKGDPLRLSQVLINLMNNSVKFTDKGEVTLKIRLLPICNGKQLMEFKVIDTGIGLKKEQLNNLFQSFFQADSSTSRNYGGTGLGLTISKQLVELMGGTISVKSEYGRGSEFIFTIATEALESHSYNLPSQNLMNKKVLIIDHNTKTKEALERMLHYFGYTTVEGNLLDSLREHINAQSFDILFIDKEILQEIFISYKCSNLRDTCNAKIVLMHSSLDTSDEYKFDDINIDAHLIKPFNHQMIFGTILKIFGANRVKDLSSNEFRSKKSLKPLKSAHILLVEDNEINQSVVIALLEDTGITITIANNGQEVLDMIVDLQHVDLILMDIEMPIMDGYETSKELRLNPVYKNTPIIALSGNTTLQDIQKSKKAGMNAHLGKPMDVNMFYGLLLEHINPKISFEERLVDAVEEFKALAGIGNYSEILRQSNLLQEELNIEKYKKILDALLLIDNSIQKHQKVFLILINNYSKVFTSFLNSKDHFNEKELFNNFSNQFRDSVEELEIRVNRFKFDEATQLSYHIRKEAKIIGACLVSQSINPIEAIEQTQRSHLNNSITQFSKVVMGGL